MDYETYSKQTQNKTLLSMGISALVSGCVAFYGGVPGVLASIPIWIVLTFILSMLSHNAEERAFFNSPDYIKQANEYRRRERVKLDARIYYESLIAEAELDMYVSEVREEVMQIAKATAKAGKR